MIDITTAQALSATALLVTLIGIVWLAYRIDCRAARRARQKADDADETSADALVRAFGLSPSGDTFNARDAARDHSRRLLALRAAQLRKPIAPNPARRVHDVNPLPGHGNQRATPPRPWIVPPAEMSEPLVARTIYTGDDTELANAGRPHRNPED